MKITIETVENGEILSYLYANKYISREKRFMKVIIFKDKSLFTNVPRKQEK